MYFYEVIKKLYYFIGSNELGFNAFFIRNDIISDGLMEEKELVKNVFHFKKCKFGMEYTYVCRWPRRANYQ